MSVTPNKKKGLRENEGGNVAVTFGLMLAPMMMLSGAAVDVGKALQARNELQAAADAAALAAAGSASQSSIERIALARKMIDANVSKSISGGEQGDGETQTTSSQATDFSVDVTLAESTTTVEVKGSIEAKFLKITGLDRIPLNVRAKAKTPYDASNNNNDVGKACVIALDPNAPVGISTFGNPDISYENCWSHTNSTSTTALDGNGQQARVVGEGHCAVGGKASALDDKGIYSPKASEHCLPMADPFAIVGAYENQPYQAKFALPAIPTTCKANNLNLKKGNFTLEPGRYCGGVSLQAHAKVKLLPGVYIFDGGELKVQSGSSLTVKESGYTNSEAQEVDGAGVLLYFHGAGAKMTVIGGGTISLKGRQFGSSYPGFLAIANVNAAPGDTTNVQGGGNFLMEGAVYMPKQNILVTGAGNANGGSQSFTLIGKTIEFQGNGEFHIKRHNASDMPDLQPDMPRQVRQEAYLVE